MQRHPIKALPWLTLEDIIIAKVALTLLFLAVFIVPADYKDGLSFASNLVWLWKIKG